MRDVYVSAKLHETPAVWTEPEAHEDDNRLRDHFLGQPQKYASGLSETCAREADGVFEVGGDPIEQRSRGFQVGYGSQWVGQR
jgi:hypothetical protein